MVFAPTQLGSQSGTLTVSDALRTQTVALTGTGAAPPALSVNPSSLSFSTQQPGVASAPQTVTVSNTGGAPMANVGFQITGAAAASYSVGVTTCGATLNGGGSCTVQVVFTPAATGAIAATLTVSSSTLGVTPVSVSLNGSAQLSSGLGGNPAQLTFPAVGVGQSSAALPVTINNTSSYAIGSLALAVSGPFSLSQNTCTGSLAAGASCTAAVTFQPTASGAATGALTVSSAARCVAGQRGVVGDGIRFQGCGFRLEQPDGSRRPDRQLYGDDQSARTEPRGAFTYTCGTLPANALCLFNPATTTVSAGATGNVTVQISTGKSGIGAAWTARPDGACFRMLCGLLLLPLVFGRRRKALAVLVAAAGGDAGGVSSCTSSGGGRRGIRRLGQRLRHSGWNLPDSGHRFFHRDLSRGDRDPDRGLRAAAMDAGEQTGTGSGLYSIFGLCRRDGSKRAWQTGPASRDGEGRGWGRQGMTAKVTVEEVERVAELAHLELTPEETGRMLNDLNAILDYVAELNELDTAGVAPLAQVSELGDAARRRRAARATVVLPSLDRAAVMPQAPETDQVFFKVPKVIER